MIDVGDALNFTQVCVGVFVLVIFMWRVCNFYSRKTDKGIANKF